MRRFKIWQIALALIAILLLLGVVIFVIWAGNPLPADEQAFTALEIDASISVDTEPWLVFKPQSNQPRVLFSTLGGVSSRKPMRQLPVSLLKWAIWW